MLNININTLTLPYTFDAEWAQNRYLERDAEESIDDAIRRIMPVDEQDICGHFLRSTEQIEQFIRDFHLGDGDDIDYSALVKDSSTALDADGLYEEVQEAETTFFRKYNFVDCECEFDNDDEEHDEDCNAVEEYEYELNEVVEEESSWAIELVTHLEMWKASQKWKALRSALVVGELCNLHDDKGRALIGVFIGRLEVLVDGCVFDLAVDSVKIEEKLSLLSLAA